MMKQDHADPRLDDPGAADASLPATYAQQQRRALDGLARFAEQARQAEQRIGGALAERRQRIQQRDARTRQRLNERREARLAGIASQHEQRKQQIEQQRTEQRRQADADYHHATEELIEQVEHAERQLREKLEPELWTADSLHEGRMAAADQAYNEACEVFEAREADLEQVCDGLEQQFRRYRIAPPPVLERVQHPPELADGTASYDATRGPAQAEIEAFYRLKLAGMFRGWRPYVLAMVPAIIAAIATYVMLDSYGEDPAEYVAVIGGAGLGGLALAMLIGWLLRVQARRQVARQWQQVRSALRAVYAAMVRDHHQAERLRRRLHNESRAQRDRERGAARAQHEPLQEQFLSRRQEIAQELENRYKLRCEQVEHEAEQQRTLLEQWRQRQAPLTEQQYATRLALLDERTPRRLREAEAEAEREYRELREAWQAVSDQLARTAELAEQLPDVFHRGWDESWSQWEPTRQAGAVVRLGELGIKPRQCLPAEADVDRYATILPERLGLPAVLDFAEQGSLLIKHDAAGREAALDMLRATVARLLVTLPPARARFTFIDPVGLGETFAGFMHLADYDDQLAGSRIWTESEHIDRRLAEMTEHMETVIQKYLRNEFATIDAYNAQAGELAEPYRFLVIADFPQNISETAARRLHAIVTSGARCGVYALLACDTRQPLPSSFAMADLESASTTFTQHDGKLAWDEHPYRHHLLMIDPAPSEALLSEVVHKAGAASREAERVEVPFGTIAPTGEQLWTGDCTDELRVPVGRSGATRLQEIRLGKGVAQHALLAGKTGSGKSTLLHAMVTNLALWYSPQQVEFYLVDFKKGVEFKTYATHHLPHARAVAVESDREFGLSVLRRLDAELERRGELFRAQGVQMLSEYRRAVPDEPMPRSLLIIDEFQELFAEDDKIAQDAALLIDRLVRQGRAFGIHVLLGSQTLAGGGGLARSTIGQMAVRIALQCNEADSQLIFDDANSAARLLNRPGEAIYNDAGGAIEGNNPFQVAWLDEPQRERYLAQAAKLALERCPDAEPAIVFEGSAPADVRSNRPLKQLLRKPDWPPQPTEAQVWLGEPITIKSPTAAALSRRSGSNVLLVGQRDDAAIAMFAIGLIGLAAQHQPGAAEFVIFDATPADAPHAGLIARAAEHLPHDVQLVKWRDTEDQLQQLNDELDRRQQSDDPDQHPPCYVFIVGLQRYRMLRRKEDDFSLSFSDDEGETAASPDKIFAELLREGPSLGMHVLTWCDTPIALDRAVDRNTLREFDWRVLFQMSATDSANLTDSPEAAQLGLYRALLHSEEQGIFEKFRPYDPPSTDWLANAHAVLQSREPARAPSTNAPTDDDDPRR